MKKPKTVLDLRKSLDMNQTEFWITLGTTQSSGSRYENGRTMPKPVMMLLKLIYDWSPK